MMFVVLRTTDRRLAGCAVVALASIVARHASMEGIPPEQVVNYLKFASHLRFDSLMAGVALALVSGRATPPPILPRWLLRWVVLPVAIAVVWCLPGAVPPGTMERVGVIGLWMVSGVLVAYAGLDQGYVLEIPGLGRVLEIIGARSYSLYLVHVTAGRLSGVLLDHAGAHPAWLVALLRRVAMLVLAELLYRIVEKPMMRVGRRLIDRA
jgi:peptidoglycan/LPS O-acetylase OafA/YrhL